MAKTRRIPPTYDGDPIPDSRDVQARRLLRADATAQRTVPGRLRSNGNTAIGGKAVGGAMALRGGSA